MPRAGDVRHLSITARTEEGNMGRKTQISQEMILEASYELLDEGGISNVEIKKIAERLGCSTRPVTWTFGSMAELKKALYFYAAGKSYVNLGQKMAGREAVEAFFISGVHYISLACDHPNVFRFMNVDNPMDTIGVDLGEGQSIFSGSFNAEAVEMLASQYDIPKDTISAAVMDTVIYTHGLALMMMYDNFRMPKEEACRMMYNVGMKLITDIGIDVSSYKFEDMTGFI